MEKVIRKITVLTVCMTLTLGMFSCGKKNNEELINDFKSSCEQNKTNKALKQYKELLERDFKGELTKKEKKAVRKAYRHCDCLDDNEAIESELNKYEDQLEEKYKDLKKTAEDEYEKAYKDAEDAWNKAYKDAEDALNDAYND